jgi:hypothetical protein
MDLKEDRIDEQTDWGLHMLASVSEQEIVLLWRSIGGTRVSEDEAFTATVAGMVLDTAFHVSHRSSVVEQ